jgi:hypothetical protein
VVFSKKVSLDAHGLLDTVFGAYPELDVGWPDEDVELRSQLFGFGHAHSSG